jgi:hypothetical protein
LLALEVKQPGVKPTAIQAQTLKDLADHGAIVRVVTAVEDVESLFLAIQRAERWGI